VFVTHNTIDNIKNTYPLTFEPFNGFWKFKKLNWSEFHQEQEEECEDQVTHSNLDHGVCVQIPNQIMQSTPMQNQLIKKQPIQNHIIQNQPMSNQPIKNQCIPYQVTSLPIPYNKYQTNQYETNHK